MKEVTIKFPLSRVVAFKPADHKRRWGQQFYDYMELDKVTSSPNREYCDKIYNAPRDEAERMVENRIDFLN